MSATRCSRAEMTIRRATTGADWIQVRDPEETKRVIEAIVACLS